MDCSLSKPGDVIASAPGGSQESIAAKNRIVAAPSEGSSPSGVCSSSPQDCMPSVRPRWRQKPTKNAYATSTSVI